MTEDLFRHLRTHVGNKRMDEKIIAQEMKELDEQPKGPTNVTNALFVGSTAELSKLIKAQKKDDK